MSQLRTDLASKLDEKLVDHLLGSYAKLVGAYRAGQRADCLRESGLFVDLTLIAIQFIRSGQVLSEVKNVSELIKQFGNDSNLPDPLRVNIPRFAQAMYEIRSKRGAVHKKEIDPQGIDAAICASTASWIIAEFIRNYHSSDEARVAEAMSSLMNVQIPLVEILGGEAVVTSTVPVGIELLLLIGQQGAAASRKTLGLASKFASQRVSDALKKLEKALYVHKASDGSFHLTTPGQRYLASELTKYAS